MDAYKQFYAQHAAHRQVIEGLVLSQILREASAVRRLLLLLLLLLLLVDRLLPLDPALRASGVDTCVRPSRGKPHGVEVRIAYGLLPVLPGDAPSVPGVRHHAVLGQRRNRNYRTRPAPTVRSRPLPQRRGAGQTPARGCLRCGNKRSSAGCTERSGRLCGSPLAPEDLGPGRRDRNALLKPFIRNF